MIMHTHEGKKTTFFHNGDYSGDVIIKLLETGLEMRVDAHDLIDFVTEYVRGQRIAALEDMTTEELLGLPKRTR
jgi:hypothetical protein